MTVDTTYYAPSVDIRVSGTTLAADVTNQVTSVTYDNNVDVADMFTVVLRNPDNQLTDSALFDLGKTVELHMGYGKELRPMMLGEITAIQPSYPESGAPLLTIIGYDKSYKLRHNQPDRSAFQFMNDSAIASLIALEAGLIPIVDPSPFVHEYSPQTGSDMAFLKERARANFFEVYVHWNKLYFRFPRPQTKAYVLEWGKNLSSFTPRLSSAGMAGLQVVRGYNEELAQTVVAFATGAVLDLDNIVERLGSNVLGLLTSLGRRVIRDQPIDNPIDALAVAKSVLQEILEGMYEGTGSCIGIPELRANEFVSIQGIGKRFSGKYRLKKVTHSISDSGYRTTFEVTQKGGANLLALLRKSMFDTPPPNRQAPFKGVVVGKVANNVDPRGRGQVKVTFPWFSDKTESAWARCVTLMAGKGRGAYFLPDVGDEVLVAFQHGDFSKPVVLGGLWNGVDRPPVTYVDPFNSIRMIKTKAGHTITLDDTIGQEKITINDKGGSEVKLDFDGSITIKAKTNLILKANGVINLDANKVDVKVGTVMDVHS